MVSDHLADIGQQARSGASGTPIVWKDAASEITRPLMGQFEGAPDDPSVACRLLCACNAYAMAEARNPARPVTRPGVRRSEVWHPI